MDRTTLPLESPSGLIELAAVRIKSEYREMPGLRLTLRQAQRLFGLDAIVCLLALERLTRDKALVRSNDGHFRL